MRPQENISKFSSPRQESCANIPVAESRALWLVILQALAMVNAAIRKYVGAKGACERCGKVL